MKKELYKKFKKIKLVLTDVDGVLTDGGMYYTTEGDIMKKFHARDGMGVTLLRKHNIPTILITKEKTKMVKQWAAKMKVEKLYDGIIKKNMILDKVCNAFNLKAGRLRVAQEFSQSTISKSENRYYHKVQRALAIKQAQMDALAARERRSPKGRRRITSFGK